MTALAQLPVAYRYVWWGTLVNRLGGFVVPLMTIYLTKTQHFSVKSAGAIVSGFGAGQIVASIAGGQLADRLGRRATMLISLFGGAAVMTALGMLSDVTHIAIAVIALGFVGELYRPAVAAYVSDVVPPAQRLDAYGLLYWAVNLGFAVSAAIGGVLADTNFHLLFYFDAGTMAVYGLIVAWKIRETRPVLSAAKRAAPSIAWWRDRTFLVFVAINFLLSLLPMQSAAPLSAHMTAQGFSAFAYGMVLATNGIFIIIAQPFVLRWIAHRDRERLLVAAALLYGAGMLGHGLAPNVPLHVVAMLVWTCGELLESPVRSAMVAQMAPEDARGRYQGAFVMTWGAASMIAPRIGTTLWQDVGPFALWTSCAGLGVFVAIAFAATASRRRPRVAG